MKPPTQTGRGQAVAEGSPPRGASDASPAMAGSAALGRGRSTSYAAGLRKSYREAPEVTQGMLLIAVSALSFSAMHAVIRHATGFMHPFEVAFFRNAAGLSVLAPFFWRHGFRILKTSHLGLHACRGGLQICAMLLFFSALQRSPLAKLSALSFTAPLFATVVAVLFLGERVRMRRVAALVLGFAGAMVIVRPGLVGLDPGAVMVLASSVLWALTLLIIKSLSGTESSLTITAYMGVFLTPLSLVPALFVWRWPRLEELLWLVLLGVLGTIGHLLMAQAFKHADATAVMPVDFSRLVWASLIGFFLFDEVPEVWTWVGGTTIFASTVYIAYREARASSAAKQE